MKRLDSHGIDACKRLGIQHAEETVDSLIAWLCQGGQQLSAAELKSRMFDDHSGFSQDATQVLVKAGFIDAAYIDYGHHERLLAYKLFEQEYTRRMEALIDLRSRTYLDVPYREKDAASSLGARWDAAKKSWFVPDGVALEAFAKWMPRQKDVSSSAPKQQARPDGNPKGSPRRGGHIDLCVDLVPKTAWFSNLRSELTADEWTLVKRATFGPARYRCQACGGKGDQHPVECHERWDYDERTSVQTLLGTVALCPACHEATHFGLARVRGRDHMAKRHLMTVNGWSDAQLHSHIRESMEAWKRRSERTWTLDARWLLSFVALSPATTSKINRHAQGLQARVVTSMQSQIVEAARCP